MWTESNGIFRLIIVFSIVALLAGCGGGGGGGGGDTPGAEETNANLTRLEISQGTLAFDPDITDYNVEVVYSVSSITVTASPYEGGATMKINNAAVTPGAAYGPINLNVGSNTIQVMVTSSDMVVSKTYTIVVTRLSDLSHNANLASLTISSGTLSPGFNENIVAYNAQVSEDVSSITLTPTIAGVNAAIKVNGSVVASGTASQSLALISGTNTITVVVTAEDGTTKTYTVVFSRVEVSHNANLAKLTISQGSLSPGFSVNTTSYSTQVSNSVTTLTLTPTAADSDADITVNGATVKSGTPSKAVSLGVGSNTITIKVTAVDGTTTKTYTLTATRLSETPTPPSPPVNPPPVGLSHNANLANLTLSSGTLSPGFNENTFAYSVQVPYEVSSITVTPTRAGVNATIKVNDSTVSSGTASTSIALGVGANTITIFVTAEDGTTTKTYTLEAERLAEPSHIANLADLTLSSGNLTPGFSENTTDYSAEMPNSVEYINVTPTAAGVNATIKVNDSTVSSGTASTQITLSGGLNTILVVVTAEDETTSKTYTIAVTRLTESSHNANMNNLTLSSSTLSPGFNENITDYTAQVPYSISSITATPTAAGVNANIKVNNSTVASGAASSAINLSEGVNNISIEVTAEDGIAVKTYTIAVTRQSFNPAAQDVLYTAYAGIGYGRAEYTTTDDDEFLYNVMLDDLNTLAGNLVQDTIFNDTNVLTKLISLVLGGTTTFTYTDSYGVISSIKVNPGALVHGYRAFVADLSVNFSSTAYPLDPNNLLKCQYYGPDGGIDLTASVMGYYKATTAGLEELFLSSVTITPKTTLKAVYPKGEVRYNNWKIDYQVYYGDVDPTYTTGMSTIPVNMKVAPTLISAPTSEVDFRDYNLSGGFTLNGNAYEFGTSTEVVNYQQEQGNGLTLISIAGKLKVPGQTSQVIISTPTVNPIIRNITGFWTSGLMNFTGLDGASQVIFNSNYSCTFSGGNQGSWTVNGWQNTLEP